jgi:hypothetical protein
MPFSHEWQSRIKQIEKHYTTVRYATDHLLEQARRDPTILPVDMKPRHLSDASDSLEGTYFIRLFAEFETGLRLYWTTIRPTNPRCRDLLDGIAATRTIPDELRDNAHRVREYRNLLVHEREQEAEEEPILVAQARSYLCTFFSFLPPVW